MKRLDSPGRILLVLCCVALGGCVENGSVVAEPTQPSASAAERDSADERPANRLAGETSPYLLQHAHNPVDWHPWGLEAFETARKENKPIFLSVGYSSCHWCHVMERLVFENPEIAAYMNEHFVNVKVDREERPDVDDIYMTALQVYFQLIGSPQNGGWPLSMFLMPDGRPFAGGTYFPPEDAEGRKGFLTVARIVHAQWTEHREQVEANAELLTSQIRRVMRPPIALAGPKLDRTLVTAVADALLASYDEEHGGLDFRAESPDAPKFPVPAKLALLQYEAERSDRADAASALEHTLDRLAAGGIHDHLGGGFHRYSTDREWHVPHFEKMLYDQAQLADIYLEAYRRTNKQLYRETAEGIFAFVLREMTDETGGFHSALDAETDGVEGAYYVWSPEEVERVLGRDDARLFSAIYGLDRPKVFEHGYVLHRTETFDESAESLGMAPLELRQRLDTMRGRLLAARGNRQPLRKDDKILTSWNGLMIHALARGGALLGRSEYTRAAERAALFVLSELRDGEGRLHRTWRADQPKLNACLDDYAFLVRGLLTLHGATGHEKWLNAARRLTDDQIEQFWDEKGHGFCFTPDHHEELIARTRNAYDGVLPAGNSVSALNLLRLAQLTGHERYRRYASETIETFVPAIERSPRTLATLALAVGVLLDSADADADAPPSQREAAPVAEEADATQDIPDEPDEAEGAAIRQVNAESPQQKKKDDRVTAKAFLSVDRLPAGGTCEIVVLLEIQEGWHINTNPAQPETLVPTKLTIKPKHGTKLAKVHYPPGKKITVPGLKEPQLIYEERVAIRGILEVPRSAGGSEEEIEISVRYQACNESTCLPPKTVTLSGKLAVAPAGEQVKQINQNLFPPLETQR